MPANAACTAILVHGIGSQLESWSQAFRKLLRSRLGVDAGKVTLVDAYWAPLSTSKELFFPTMAPTPGGVSRSALESEVYQRASADFLHALAVEAGAPSTLHGFGSADLGNWLKQRFEAAHQVVEDVGNYVARNGVRTAVQHVVHSKLAEAHSGDHKAPVLLVSHSQGTIICYDVLRQAGGSYPRLLTWITMGSPLRKYFGALQWGRQQLGMPSSLRWLNLYDSKDIVGKDLRGALEWQAPQPQDQEVDNRKNAGGAHDHWNNGEVVKAVASEIQRLLA